MYNYLMSNNVITQRHRNLFLFGVLLCFMMVSLHFVLFVSSIVSFWCIFVYLSIYLLLLCVIICVYFAHIFVVF